MYRILIVLCIFLYIFHAEVRGEEPEVVPAEQEKEKSELAKLMSEIDTNYKAVEVMSGWYKYKKKHWKIILESGQNMVLLTKSIRRKFSRPDDWTYQELMEKMQIAAEELVEVAQNKDKEGALEDTQWQVRLLRRTCAKCHKHLDIHIYPQLYKKKPKEVPPVP
ncbi:hypothetical protein LCGC14_1811360 [marine sediment metagenome]|uniref:Cytochrome c domain-containing protein n=1 Tax=marine sediment metagenome TaxID=412755 RepID=A0A0F9GLU2_9ZZZZ